MKWNRRGIIRMISFFAAIVLILTVFLLQGMRRENYYRRAALSLSRQSAVTLSHETQEVMTLLQKCSLSPSDEFTRALASRLYGSALNAANAMVGLPWQHELDHVSALMDDVGMNALRWAETGRIDKDKLQELKRDVDELNTQLGDSVLATAGSRLSFGRTALDPYRDAAEEDLAQTLNAINDTAGRYGEDPGDAQSSADLSQGLALASRLLERQVEELSAPENKGERLTLYRAGDRMVEVDNSSGALVFYQDLSCPGGEQMRPGECADLAVGFIKENLGMDTVVSGIRQEDGYIRIGLAPSRPDITMGDHNMVVVVDGSDGRIAAFHLGDRQGSLSTVESMKKELGDLSRYPQPEYPAEVTGEPQLCSIKTSWGEDRLCYRVEAQGPEDAAYILYYDCETGAAVDLRLKNQTEDRLIIR